MLIQLTVRVNAKRSDLTWIHWMLSIICTLFYGYLKRLYSAESSQFLSHLLTNKTDRVFIRRFILNKLMTKYIRIFLEKKSWEQVNYFLNRNCRIERKNNGSKAKLLLCTHTGDYWVSILMVAREYEGMERNVIVPVYQNITAENQAMYDKITILGVKVIFICIHNDGALKQVVRHMMDPHSIVAIFYDLYSYSAGIYNGVAEPVSLFGRHAHMTTGILQIAQRMKLTTSFVSCHYSESNKYFQTEITSPFVLSPGDNTQQEMVAYLESKIRETPWQWHFISLLDTYYHFPFSTLQAWHSRQQSLFIRLNAKYQGRRA